MMNEWKKVPLPQLLEFIVDNRGKTVPIQDVGIPLIATNCIKSNELYPVFEKVRYLSEETYNNWFRAHPKPGDIIFVNKGTPGRVCMVPDPVNFCIAQDMMAFRTDNTKIYNKYLFAVLRSPAIQKHIENCYVGTLIPHFKKGDLNKLLIPIPKREIQEAIGDFYFSICDKIELNNKINKNLEAQAQAIFKSWFVDFEPFQDGEFVDSELGRIPKGWRVGTLGDYVRVKSGFAFKSAWWQESGIPVIKIKNIGNNTLDLNDVSYVSKEKKEIAKDFIANAGDLLIAMTGATIGKFAIVPMCKDVLLVNQRVGKFFLGDNPIEKLPFIHNILGLDYVQEAIVTRGSGSAQPNISPTSIETIPIILPPADIISKFNNLVKSFYKNIIYNEQEIKTITTLRDTLLPKLMSGEIRVPVEVE